MNTIAPDGYKEGKLRYTEQHTFRPGTAYVTGTVCWNRYTINMGRYFVPYGVMARCNIGAEEFAAQYVSSGMSYAYPTPTINDLGYVTNYNAGHVFVYNSVANMQYSDFQWQTYCQDARGKFYLTYGGGDSVPGSGSQMGVGIKVNGVKYRDDYGMRPGALDQQQADP